MKAAILFSVIISAFALDCPVYQCTDLGQGVCAQQQGGSILLNQNGCGDGQSCDISQVYDPTGTLPAQSVQCLNQSEINTNPLQNLNLTELFANITANATSISAEPAAVNATGAEGAVPVNVTANVTTTEVTTGNATAVPVNVTTNVTTTEVTTGNATAGGTRRLQGPRDGVGAPAPAAPGAAPAPAEPNATVPITTVNVTTAPVPIEPNATAPAPSPGPTEPNATAPAPTQPNATAGIPITTVNVTTVTPLQNATATPAPGEEAQPPTQPLVNATAVPAPGQEVQPPTEANATAVVVNATTAEGEANATAIAANVTGAEAENATVVDLNATQIVSGVEALNQTGLATATLENTPVISTNEENTTQIDISNIAQTISPLIQQTDQGYEVDIPGIGLITINSEGAKQKITCQIVPNRNLQSGSNPKTCSADADCQLQDGSLATCVCGLDGQSYCQPDYYDDEFSVFTDQCVDGSMDQDVFVEWIRYHQFYVALKSDPGCGADLFLQLEKANQSQSLASESASSGELLAFSLIMVMLLMA